MTAGKPAHPATAGRESDASTAPLGPLGERGLRTGLRWTTQAAARAVELAALHRAGRAEVVDNPHLTDAWAAETVRSTALLDAVRSAIGPAVAVEHTFLVVKWPGARFTVPWHQDGIDRRIELDPERSVSAWLAVGDAAPDNGCLRVLPGSQRLGYLPFETEPEHGGPRGRGDQASGFAADGAAPLPVDAGGAVLMDSRLLHSSGPNTGRAVRIGLNIRYVAPGGCLRRDPSCPGLTPISGTGW